MKLSLEKKSDLNVAEALAVLLQTWNKQFYRYHRKFSAQHFRDIERLVTDNERVLLGLRDRSIDTLTDNDKSVIKEVFNHFEGVMGPVGAAKSLHLMAPRFFPLWDRAIANAYRWHFPNRLGLKTGNNGERYWCFTQKMKEQCEDLQSQDPALSDPLKALDEHNFCVHTRKL